MTEIDARAARRRFDRAAKTYLGAARLETEVGARMLERLDYVRVAPAAILDAGCGPAPQAAGLARRYPRAALLALDFSLPMLAAARRAAGWRARLRGRRALAVCAALERLPLAAGSVQLAWSNMALHWAADAPAALAELARVLAPEGLLMFSTLGPDTLKELRAPASSCWRIRRAVDRLSMPTRDIGNSKKHRLGEFHRIDKPQEHAGPVRKNTPARATKGPTHGRCTASGSH